MIQIGDTKAWLWVVAVEPIHRVVLGGVYISRYRNMLVAEHFLYSLVEKYGIRTVYSDGGSSWYSEACTSLRLEHQQLHSPSYEKSIIERKSYWICEEV